MKLSPLGDDIDVPDLLVSFANSKIVRAERPWGVMLEVHHPDRNLLLKDITIFAGCRTSLHVHDYKDEIDLVFDGTGSIMVKTDAGTVTVDYAGEVASGYVHIMPRQPHRMVGPLRFLEISTYHPDDVTRLEDDYGRSDLVELSTDHLKQRALRLETS